MVSRRRFNARNISNGDTRQSSVPLGTLDNQDTRQSVSLGTLALAESINTLQLIMRYDPSPCYYVHATCTSKRHLSRAQQILPYSLLIRVNIIMHSARRYYQQRLRHHRQYGEIHLHQMMTTTATTLHLAAKVWGSTCPHHRHRLHHQQHQ